MTDVELSDAIDAGHRQHVVIVQAMTGIHSQAVPHAELDRTRDAIHMACLGLGMNRNELADKPALFAIINTNSPMQLDGPMAEGLIEMASAGQVVCISPFTLAGAMAPITLAGALTQGLSAGLFGHIVGRALVDYFD